MKRPNLLVGLSQLEVEQAKQEHQLNQDVSVKERSVFSIIRKNTLTLFNAINVVIALALIYAQSYRNLLFLIVVVCNTLIGIIQEIRAKKLTDKLQLLNQDAITVIRDGEECQVYPNNIALYDLLVLKRGNQIPADCQVEKGKAMVDESLLTGESDLVTKQLNDILLSGSFVQSGLVFARVVAVAENCYAKKLQFEMRKAKRPQSKLLTQMNAILKYVSFIIFPLAVLLLFLSPSAQLSITEKIPQVAAALIGMIPSGLVLLCSVALALGIINLGKENVIVNELSAIENLARVDTFGIDKTGTITTGQMQFEQLVSLNGNEEENQQHLVLYLKNKVESTATTQALKEAFNIVENECAENEYSIPFSSDRKWSSAYVQGQYFVLGAPSFITNDITILNSAKQYEENAFRTLLFATSQQPITEKSNLTQVQVTPLCFVLVSDVVRQDITPTIQYFYQQGVDVKVISGDSPEMVSTIAKKVGVKNYAHYVNGSNLPADIENYSVFGRVTPQNKKEIIETLEKQGHSVAMTGDGVNDLPALKVANCSVAMGSGSEATKKVAQMVLLHNNFSVMPQIINEGRRIINNISLSISLFLNKTIFSILLSFLSLVFAFAYPFQPIQLTLISTLTIGIPSFLFTFEKNYKKVHINVLEIILKNSLPTGIASACSICLFYIFGKSLMLSYAQTSTLFTLVVGFVMVLSLCKVAYPFNLYRGSIIILLCCAFLGIVLIFPQFFYLLPLSMVPLKSLLILLFLALFIYFSTYFLIQKIYAKVKH